MSTERYEGVQTLRFIAAFLVVVTHATFYTSDRLLPGTDYWPDGAGGVPIFFVISGFVMVVSTTTLRDRPNGWLIFIWRRLIRIVPMYWLATTVKLAVLVALPFAVLHTKFNLIHIVSSYFLIPTTNAEGEYKPLLAVGWTLYFEFFFYYLFAFSLYLRTNVYVFLGIVLSAFAALSPLRQPASPAGMMFFNAIVLQFYFGMLVAKVVGCDRPLPQVAARYPLLPALLAMLGLGLLISPVQLTSFPDAFRTGIPATMIVFGAALLEPALRGRIPRHFLVLGDASYSLYLFHALVAPIVPTILQKLGFHNYAISVALTIMISVSVGVAIYFILERPLTRKLRSIKPDAFLRSIREMMTGRESKLDNF
jgi:exopolysaccharide production protein ExoZ